MPRPLVAVFQEYASLNFTPATADLNTCIGAVAKQVKVYNDAQPSDTLVPQEFVGEDVFLTPNGLRDGALLEPGKAEVTVVDPEVQITETLAPTFVVADEHPITLSDASKVKKDDNVYVDGVWVGTVNTVDVATGIIHVSNPPGTGTAGRVVITRPVEGTYTVRSQDVSPDALARTVRVDGIAELVGTGLPSNKLAVARKVYVGFVAARTDLAFAQSISSAAEIPTKLGLVHPDNPLALAAWVALQNTGTKILVYGVPGDDDMGFAKFQRDIAARPDIYCVVPVSMVPSVQLAAVQALKNKFVTMADPTNALEQGVPQRFKMVVAGGLPPVRDPALVYTFSSEVTSTLVDSSTDYRVEDPRAKFVDAKVTVGDLVSTDTSALFGRDARVQRVVSNTVLIVSEAVDPAKATRILRPLLIEEKAKILAGIPKGIGSKRAVLLLADYVKVSGVDDPLSSAYLGCAVGGMIAGLPPHAGLTNLYVAGITKVAGTNDTYADAELSDISDGGWCVFVQDNEETAPYCLHGLTTDTSTTEFGEIMSVKNFDYVASVLSAQLNSFIGTWNLNIETFGFMTAALESALLRLRSRNVVRLGAPVISSSITSLGQSPFGRDRAEVYVTLQLPMSLNQIGLHLVSV